MLDLDALEALGATRFVFQLLSVALFIALCWTPRYTVFMASLLLGIVRSLSDWNLPRDDPASLAGLTHYQWIDGVTTCVRMLAALEAFARRTEDITQRWWLFGMCGAGGALIGTAVFGLARETKNIPLYTNARMAVYFAGAVMLAGLLVAMSRTLKPAYRCDQVHTVLLCIALGGLGLSGLIRLRDDLQWLDVGVALYWLHIALLVGWLVAFGHPLLTIGQKLIKATLVRCRQVVLRHR